MFAPVPSMRRNSPIKQAPVSLDLPPIKRNEVNKGPGTCLIDEFRLMHGQEQASCLIQLLTRAKVFFSPAQDDWYFCKSDLCKRNLINMGLIPISIYRSPVAILLDQIITPATKIRSLLSRPKPVGGSPDTKPATAASGQSKLPSTRSS
ncbi:hypothetical protein HNY73_014587 [Argiope bruennichi]|uniref:Uncharacterized protein n=1 Tax=Argiope bruennichi TaxID=94029 RepID=A0A8T0EPQ9_ARGBR|nr:hypothetical protein HNY73_014587 [Argiope bruennichi]